MHTVSNGNGTKPHWGFIAVSNIVPAPDFSVEQLAVRCGVCRAGMTIDHRGGLCTGPTESAFVCDRCGDTEAPAEMALVRQLRAAGPYTVTLDGADPDQDPFARTCPVCDHDQDARPDGWHIVDTVNGRPVCPACARGLDANLATLADQLNLREQQYAALPAQDASVRPATTNPSPDSTAASGLLGIDDLVGWIDTAERRRT